MGITLTNSDLNELVVERQNLFLVTNEKALGIQEYEYCVEHHFGKMQIHEIEVGGIHISYGDAIIKNGLTIIGQMEMPVITMHFNLQGASKTSWHQNKKAQYFATGQHNFFFIPNFNSAVDFVKQEVYKFFEIKLSYEFINRLLTDDIPESFGIKNALAKQTFFSLSPHQLPITLPMYKIIGEIMDCKVNSIYKKLFLEAKVTELLSLQLEQNHEHDCTVFCSLKKDDIDKIYAVKDIISKNIQTPQSLFELSQKVGLNDFKLKKGFKEIFGTTVFGYLSDVKMEYAMQLIADKKHTIAEVADLVGYKNATHFTAAFKLRFGKTPKAFK